jgi:hypothetical protein
MRTLLELNDLPPLRADVDQAERVILDIASGARRSPSSGVGLAMVIAGS